MASIKNLKEAYFCGPQPPKQFPVMIHCFAPSSTQKLKTIERLDGDEMICACLEVCSHQQCHLGCFRRFLVGSRCGKPS
jgi:hypothetical protein